jgi:Tol biopolymer transport system component
MDVRTKALTVSTALCASGIIVGVLVLSGSSAETQVTASGPPVQQVSVAANGGSPNGNSSGAATSGNGRCVAFYSDASNIVPSGPTGSAPGFTNVFVTDRDSGITTQVSIGFNGQQPNGPSQAQRFRPSIDADCTCVGFSSDASNLVPNDTNGKTDVFVRDLPASTTELASFGFQGEPANGASSFTSVSGDCSRMAFQSLASNLVPNDTNGTSDIFVFDRASDSITRVSVGPGGVQGNGPSITPSMSADGRCVAFASGATNLLPNVPDTNGVLDIYVECEGVVTCRASVSSSGEQANAISFLPALSADGRIVAFKSNASNLVPGDRNQAADVFVHNCDTGETVRASVGDRGQEGNDIAIPPTISGNGRFVAFGSFASNLISGVSTNGNSQVYVRDLVNQTTELVSVGPNGRPGNGGVPDIPPSISLDASYVAFESLASNLVPGYPPTGLLNVFLGVNVTIVPTATPTATPSGNTPTATATGPTATATNTGPTPENTPTATPTRIPCHQDTDCPLGQVCGPDGFCEIAPTPTPTIHCTTTEDCPSGLTCVNGICRDLSTPTATPTPLPTCVTDEDCEEPGTHCRAGVCVPIRPCPDGQVECRGEREVCLDGTCECGGDCNLDGIVFGTEITRMVCIVGGGCGIDVCPAGDINQDGMVTAGDITLAVINLGLGCPGEGSPLIYAFDRTNETRTINIGSTSGIPGENISVEIGMSGGGDVTTAQVDMLVDANLLQVSTDPSQLPCTIAPRLADRFTLAPQLPQVPPAPPGMVRIRLAIVDQTPPIDSFDPGPIMSCNFRIRPTAAPGFTQLIADGRLEIGDPAFNQFNAQVTNGAVEITAATPCDNGMCPSGTQCRAGVCKPIISCSGPTAGPTECLDGRQACVNNVCECVGDCNLDGIVRGAEITTMVTIINGLAPLSECPAADFNGDGIIRGAEVTIAVVNINEGCP